MDVRGSLQILSEPEMERIEGATKRVLARMGMQLEHEGMLRHLAEAGWPIDLNKRRVFFPEDRLEAALGRFEPFDWDHLPPYQVQCGVYTWLWLPPGAERAVPQTVETVANLTRLGDWLPNADCMIGMGTPTEVPAPVLPLWCRFLAWRYAERTRSDGEGYSTLETMPYVNEMCAIVGKPAGSGVIGGLRSPLSLGRHYCEMYWESFQRGWPAGLYGMPSIGGTTPVTLAGAVSVQLAEIWAIALVQQHFYGQQTLGYGPSLSPLDMSTGHWRFGRPEVGLTHVAIGNLAKRRRASFHSNSFLAEAGQPSEEMAYGKALSAIPTLLAGSLGTGSSGLLALDEVMSPVQMVLDDEFAGALKRLGAGFEITEETLAEELVEAVGPGGPFMGQDHTARHFREELWLPRLWSRHNYAGWLTAGAKTERQQAEEIYAQVMAEHHPQPFDEATERALLAVIRKAERDLLGQETRIEPPEG